MGVETGIARKERILNGNIRSLMIQLSTPAILAMVLFGLNAFMDTVYVGQLMNEKALGGIAIAYPLTSLAFGFGSLAGTGAGNLLSIALGQNDTKKLSEILPNATLVVIVCTVLFAVPSYIFAEDLIRFMGGKGTVAMYGTTYFKVTLLGAPFWIYGLALNMVVRAEGKMGMAALMMSYGLILNLILTPIFIHYLDMGVEGAAWATNCGMFIYCVVGYFYFKSTKPSFGSNVNAIHYSRDTFRSILGMGFPGFIMSVMGLVQSIVVLNAISRLGTDDDLAFFASANRILLFLMTPLFGLMRALQPIIGINYGAGQIDRVKDSFRQFTYAGMILIAPFWILMMLFPDSSLHLMLPEGKFTDEDIIHFRTYISILPALPFVFMTLTYFPAIGEPKYASLFGIARQLVFYVPAMLILPIYMGLGGIYYGSTIIDVIISVWMLYYVVRSFGRISAPKTNDLLTN